MTNDQARVLALTTLATFVLMSEDLGAQGAASWSLCGPGRYELAAGGQPLGTEVFEIACHSNGYTATGRTQLSMTGATVDLTTHLELGTDFVPASASAKGTVNGQPFDQSGTFRDGTATLTTNGQQQSVPYTKSASWLGGNIFYPNVFIAARYDEAKGGAQTIPIFPQMAMTLERTASDTVRLDNGETATFTRFVARVAIQQFILWRDGDGRLAVIASPAQQFAAVRTESAKWLPALMAKLTGGASAAPTHSATAIDYSAPPGATFTAEEVTIPVAT